MDLKPMQEEEEEEEEASLCLHIVIAMRKLITIL